MSLQVAINTWRAMLGASHVLDAEHAQSAYGDDTSGSQRKLGAAIRIQDASQIAEVVRIANECRISLYPISTGRNWGYGTSLPASHDSVILDLSALKKIVHFDAELGVVTVEPGVTQGMLAEFLEKGNHPFLVPVTGAGPECSLLGNALERGYGITPYTDHWGAVTDIEAVLADGALYRTAMREAGGEELSRLFKWGIGPYSAGLFTQSGFGIVTRMSILLARRPECVKMCFFNLKRDDLLETGVERVRAILRSLPGLIGGINLMNRHRMLAMSAPYPKSRVGADGLIPAAVVDELGKQYQIAPWTGVITLYGTRRTVAAAEREIKRALAGVGSRVVMFTANGAATLLKAVSLMPGALGEKLTRTANTLAKGLELVNGRPNETALPLAYWRGGRMPENLPLHPSRDGCGLIWYAPLVPMRPTMVRAYVEKVMEITAKHGIEPLLTMTSISDKVFDSTVPILFDRNSPRELAAANACYQELLQAGQSMGVFPYRVGVDTMGTLLPMQPLSKAFHDKLRHQLDPQMTIAPGRYQ